MSSKSLYILGIIVTIVLGMYFNWLMCCHPRLAVQKNQKTPPVVVEETPPVQETSVYKNGFAIKDEQGSFAYATDNTLDFAMSSDNLIQPVGTEIQKGIEDISTYLQGKPNKTLDITGYYKTSETYNGAFDNLGISRANAVKNYFVTKGVSSKQMNLYGKVMEDMEPNSEAIFRGPVAFAIKTAEEDQAAKEAEALQALKKKIQADPLVLYFDTGESNITLSESQKHQFTEISQYLDKTDDKALVVGHTDNVGRRVSNIKLGLERANFARDYLIENGIASDKVDTESKGPDKPIAKNTTPKGRAKNRRCVVTIK